MSNVETSVGPTADGAMTPKIHEGLKEKGV